MSFREVNPRPSFPAMEEALDQWWNERDIARRSLESGDRSRPFIFFEGPPTANGLPGLHHVEARAAKDVVIRYRRMRGQYVIGARGGWDTHGLPVEIAVEKELGFSGKPDIEKHGIAAFNQACRESVWRYIKEWEKLTNRIAYWLDLERPYVTYHNEYIESLWWILKTLWDKGLITRDYKVTMHCPRCGTSLSDHEVSQGFQDDVEDPSVWVRLRLRPSGHALDERLAGASLLIWTTTPWTLPANAAAAVNPQARYVLVEVGSGAGADGAAESSKAGGTKNSARTGQAGGTKNSARTGQAGGTSGDGGDGAVGDKGSERLIMAEALAGTVLADQEWRVVDTVSGTDLIDLRYEPLFRPVAGPAETVPLERAHRVIADDFVSLEDGSGVVHIAPAYGDLEVGRRYGIPTLFSVDLAGMVMPEFAGEGLAGLFFKKADPVIMKNLRQRGLLLRSGTVRHSYPFCWRCDTPLLYFAKPSWYIRTTARKDALVAHNEQINWVPEHIRRGRFGNWLENNIDWALSRERYWGTPLPLWVCDGCGGIEVIGSVAELSARCGRDLCDMDLHRPYVDELTWSCAVCGGTARRIPDVADCWFDSGAMPVAQWHYPFENRELFEVAGQADFISEAIDQTRGWFYTLHALATLLFDRPAFRNVICLGHILDIKGQKMSKSKGNVVDPWQLIRDYGADATRWYMYASAPPYNPRRFAPDHVGEVVRRLMLTIWNTYSFFVTYANLDGWSPARGAALFRNADLQDIDRWALARLNALVRDVGEMIDRYDIHGPARALESFTEELSNWYVRRNRRRYWKAESDGDKQAAYATLYTCLTTLARLLAPFVPHLSEELYRGLVAEQDAEAPESVHLAGWPEHDPSLIDERLISTTALLLQVVSLGRAARRQANLRVRQPVSEILVVAPRGGEDLRGFTTEIAEELNVKSVRFLEVGSSVVEYRFKPNLPVVGRKRGKLVPAMRAALAALVGDAASSAARGLQEGRDLELVVEGQTLQVAADEVLVEAISPEGFAVAGADGVMVALNTTITPELTLEGRARDLVRYIQDARKSAGLRISDRIEVALDAEADLSGLLQAHGAYIAAETLADALEAARPAEDAFTVQAELDTGPVTVGVRRRPS